MRENVSNEDRIRRNSSRFHVRDLKVGNLYVFCGDGTTCFTYEDLVARTQISHLTGSHAHVSSDNDFESHYCQGNRARQP